MLTKVKSKLDKSLLIAIILLTILGLITFLSASLGIFPTDKLKFFTVIKSQILYIFIFGSLAIFLGSKINYKYYKKYSFLIFVATFLISFLVFIPGLGLHYNGAHRWIVLFNVSLQPAELLKFSSIILIATFCAKYAKHFNNYKIGLLPFVTFLGVVAIALLLEPDFGTFTIVCASSFVIYFIAGAKWRDILITILLGIVAFAALVAVRPYMRQRIQTFLKPHEEILDSGWQRRQSLIAIGSGELTGRGLGQSIQKYRYLPEGISDSIFAVYAEELGLIGCAILFSFFLFIILRGVHIARRTEDDFGKYLAIGIVSILFFQMVLNIASSLGAPATGVPLPLISKGGTSLVIMLFELGILLNISKYSVKL